MTTTPNIKSREDFILFIGKSQPQHYYYTIQSTFLDTPNAGISEIGRTDLKWYAHIQQ